MWLAELNGNQYWLLPGLRYMLGRPAKYGEPGAAELGAHVSIAVREQSVSREHAILEVEPVDLESARHPSLQSKLFITDTNSRFGTSLNHEPLMPGKRTRVSALPKEPQSARLGRIAVVKLTWVPFVLTCAARFDDTARQDAVFEDAVRDARDIDIRVAPTIVRSTGVLVVLGRPAASAYFALARNLPVVSHEYLAAVVAAARLHSRSGSAAVIPDPNKFLISEAWRGNIERSQCLRGQHFYTDNESLIPLVVEAGGSAIFAGTSTLHTLQPEANTLIISKRAVKRDNAVVTDADLFQAILECRRVRSMIPPSASKARRNRILDILTSDPVDNVEVEGSEDFEDRPGSEQTEDNSTKMLVDGSCSFNFPGNTKTKPSASTTRDRPRDAHSGISREAFDGAELAGSGTPLGNPGLNSSGPLNVSAPADYEQTSQVPDAEHSVESGIPDPATEAPATILTAAYRSRAPLQMPRTPEGKQTTAQPTIDPVDREVRKRKAPRTGAQTLADDTPAKRRQRGRSRSAGHVSTSDASGRSNSSSSSAEEKELDQTNLSRIGGLVLVENTMSTDGAVRPHREALHNDVLDFKAFQRRVLPPQSRTVPFNEEVRDDPDEADRFVGTELPQLQPPLELISELNDNEHSRQPGILGDLNSSNNDDEFAFTFD